MGLQREFTKSYPRPRIIEMGGTARGIECDVADRVQVDNLINTVSKDFGRRMMVPAFVRDGSVRRNSA